MEGLEALLAPSVGYARQPSRTRTEFLNRYVLRKDQKNWSHHSLTSEAGACLKSALRTHCQASLWPGHPVDLQITVYIDHQAEAMAQGNLKQSQHLKGLKFKETNQDELKDMSCLGLKTIRLDN